MSKQDTSANDKDVNQERNIVTKGNDLIAASYDLTVREQRLLLAAISHIFPMGPMPKEIIVTAEFYSQIFNVKNPWRDMAEAADRLFKREFRFETDDENVRRHWVSEIAHAKNHGYVRVVFSEQMEPHLSQLTKRFSSYDLSRISKLTSTYAIRIFEMLIQWRVTGSMKIKLEDLHKRLSTPASYKDWTKFRNRVLDPAVKEINAHAHLKVSYETIFQGRAVHGLEFTIKELYQGLPATHDQPKPPAPPAPPAPPVPRDAVRLSREQKDDDKQYTGVDEDKRTGMQVGAATLAQLMAKLKGNGG